MNFTVLFVSDTDTSLSPLAVNLLERILETEGLANEWNVEGSGTHVGGGGRIVHTGAQDFGLTHDLALQDYRSKQTTPEMLQRSRLVLAMTEDNFWYVERILQEHNLSEERELFLVTHFAEQLGLRGIGDPLLGEETYEEAFRLLTISLERLLPKLRYLAKE